MSENLPSSPLANIVKRAASLKTTGPASQISHRFDHASQEIVVLCDVSGSMLDAVGSLNMTKHEHLKIALVDVLKSYPKLRLVAFASWPKEFSGANELPSAGFELGGGTNLAKALQTAAKWNPWKTIVISDGLPDNEDLAVQAAQAMTGAIDTIYCGPDSHPAVAFLAKLSRTTGGQQMEWTGSRELAATIRGLLPAPVR